jgi:hypothetical protein
MASQRFPALRPLVLCDAGREAPAQAAGFHVQAWEDFLMGNGLGESAPRT